MSRSAFRHAHVAILLIALLPVVAALGPRAAAQEPPSEAARRDGSISAIVGEQVWIDGTAPKQARKAVVLQRRVDGDWRAADRGRTDRAGRYAFAVQVREEAAYRVVTRKLRRGVPLWASARTTVRVVEQGGTASAPASVSPGGTAAVQATFVPARPGRPVRLESRSADGSWATVTRGLEDARGAVTLEDRPAATVSYRLVAEAWGGAPAFATQPVTVTVTSGTPTGTATPTATATPTGTPTGSPTPTGTATATPTSDPDGSPWVTGYYAAWFHDWLYPPEEVDMEAMTHFVYGRVAPGGGSLAGEPNDPRFPDYPYEPGDVVPGSGSAGVPGSAPDGSGRSIEDYLVDRAHAAGTKALLMLGGDGDDGLGFLRSTYGDVQEIFVENIVDYLVDHDYDGVDVDWENCLSDTDSDAHCIDQSGRKVPAAKARERLVDLIDAIRAEMATRERYADEPGLITFPGYTIRIEWDEEAGEFVPGVPDDYQVEVAERVDQYNLMSYGVGTAWGDGGWESWFSGPLHGASGNTPVDISSSVAAYEAAGVPRDRIGIGIGFYGLNYGTTVTGPRQSLEHNDVFEFNDTSLSYSELDRLGFLSHGSLEWDEEAKSTYRVYVDDEHPDGYTPEEYPEGASASGYLSYEDERSIAAKGAWVKETGVGGTILWTINYGWLPRTQSNPLMDAVKDAFLD